ncbi:MAG: LemA family protein [Clostridia bacterium]|nr:LemA family protein [Clostridia bacterium]
MDYIFWIILAIIVIIIILIIALYNNLVNLKMKVKNAWAQIDTQLARRFDLIPNLIETVKGYSIHEKETLEKIIQARNSYINSNEIEDKTKANIELTNNLKNLFALAEAYPDLKANQNFLSLQTELSNTEDKIAYSRQFYNDTVQIYNTAILRFPSNLFAKILGFKEIEFFELNEKNKKENINIKF